MNTRKSGFYFVKFDGTWTVGEWFESRGLWYLMRMPISFTEANLDEINETPLLPPKE